MPKCQINIACLKYCKYNTLIESHAWDFGQADIKKVPWFRLDRKRWFAILALALEEC